jgi:molybdopterin converting factor subunit 1
MEIEILLFGILRDVIGKNNLNKELVFDSTLENLKKELADAYPNLNQYNNYSIAVNEMYVEGDYILKDNDVVALIPPVSGG